MGNHNVGRAMASAAKVFWLAQPENGPQPTKEKALEVLDAAAEDFYGSDAEFDDHLHPETPLGRLVAIAFEATPEELIDEEDENYNNPWYDGPESRLRQRYRFC